MSTNSSIDTKIQPVTRPSKRGNYRRHTDEFKRDVVAQSLRGDSSVSRVAREHNVNANQVFAWRKQFGDGRQSVAADACTFLPVALASEQAVRERDEIVAGLREQLTTNGVEIEHSS